jgi:hypothetical protein
LISVIFHSRESLNLVALFIFSLFALHPLVVFSSRIFVSLNYSMRIWYNK